jgi:3,4-dihydroxy 2-butanone 4-phosphate synthase/GTP cyclohydrolase II
MDERTHLALVKGEFAPGEPVLVRVHSECLTGDVLGSLRCDCGGQLQNAMRQIDQVGKGVLLYMRQEGRGIGLANKIKAYHLQEQGYDTVEANNPKKIVGLEGYGLEVVERVPIEMNACESNVRYLETKRDKMGHILEHINGTNGSE